MDRIVHATAVDIGGGKRGFRSKDTVAGVPGTVVTAAHMNASQEEVVRAIELGGLVPDGADFTQLWQVIQRAGALGQCQLRYVGATEIRLYPVGGNLVRVAGKAVELPAVGVAAANTAVTVNGVAGQNLAANTTYLVALGATGALEFWTLGTGHARDTTAGNIGVEVIAGQPAKSLVGMVTTNASAQFADSPAFRGVISWFNLRGIPGAGLSTGGTTTASPTFVELNTVCRATFLTWAHQAVDVRVVGQGSNGTNGLSVAAGVGIDGAFTGTSGGAFTPTGGQASFTGGFHTAFLAEGPHIITPMGTVGAPGGLGTFTVAAQFIVKG